MQEESDKLLSLVDAIVSLKKDIEGKDNLNEELSSSSTWREIPLRVVTEFVHNNIRTNDEDLFGHPIFPLSYLKGNHNGLVDFVDGKTKYKRIKLDDVIFVKSGASAREIFKPFVWAIPPSLEALRCTNESILLPDYLYYLLKGYEKSFKSLATGSTIKSINAKSLLEFKCLIPPLEEQRKIVDFLDNVVGKIDDIIKSLSNTDNAFSSYRQALIENIVRGKVMV